MDLNLLILDGYGLFVWPAFMFTFIACFILFFKTKKEFKKYEIMFLNENKQLKIEEIQISREIEKLPVRRKYSTYCSSI